MTKNLRAIIYLSFLIFLPASLLCDISLSLDPPNPQIRIGAVNQVGFHLSTGPTDTLHLAEAYLYFDTTYVRVTSVSEGNFLDSGFDPGGSPYSTFWYSDSSNVIGYVRATCAILRPWGVTGEGNYAYVEFYGKQEGISELIFDPDQIYMTDNHAQTINTTHTNGTITVGNFLWAEFEGEPLTAASAPLTVNFTDLSLEGDYAISSWSWNFGDGETSNTQNPTHVYSSEGVYTVSLTVTDMGSESDTETKADYIRIGAPNADFSATPTSGDAPLDVTFTDESTQGASPITQWEWDLGNGETSTEQNPSTTYENEGMYTVSLTVTDSNGVSDTEIKNDFIMDMF